MIKLYTRDVAQAALAAYDAGQLCAQNPQDGTNHYIDDQNELITRCAIGAALNSVDAMELQLLARETSTYQIHHLIEAFPDSFDAPEPTTLRSLQIAHDNWSSTSVDDPMRSEREAKFVARARELAQ